MALQGTLSSQKSVFVKSPFGQLQADVTTREVSDHATTVGVVPDLRIRTKGSDKADVAGGPLDSGAQICEPSMAPSRAGTIS
jgi:hypothetical protein